MMTENNIDFECLFSLAKFKKKEGLMFFKPVKELVDEQEMTNLVPVCIMVDGAKFVYDDELDEEYVINSVNKVVTFTRVDGIQINIDTNMIEGFPFKVEPFTTDSIESKNVNLAEGLVALEDN